MPSCGDSDPLAGRVFKGAQKVDASHFNLDVFKMLGLTGLDDPALADGVHIAATLRFKGHGRADFVFTAMPLDPPFRCEGDQALHYVLAPMAAPAPAPAAPGGHFRGADWLHEELFAWAAKAFIVDGADAKKKIWTLTLDARDCPRMLDDKGFGGDFRPRGSSTLQLLYAETPATTAGGGREAGAPPVTIAGEAWAPLFVDDPLPYQHPTMGVDGRSAWYERHMSVEHARGGVVYFQGACPNLPTLHTTAPSCLLGWD